MRRETKSARPFSPLRAYLPTLATPLYPVSRHAPVP